LEFTFQKETTFQQTNGALKEILKQKKRVREMQADFNPFNAQQKEHKKMMIRHLEDDYDGDGDDEDVNTKKHMLPPNGLTLLLIIFLHR